MKLGQVLNIIVIATVSWPGFAGGEDPSVIRLGLKDVFKIVQESQTDIMMANERIQQALARVGQANAGLRPQLHGVISGSRQTRDLRRDRPSRRSTCWAVQFIRCPGQNDPVLA